MSQVQLSDRIHMGDEVQDIVSGFKGIAVCLTIWNNGCERIGVQPKARKDGKVSNPEWFDEPALKVLKKRKVKLFARRADKPGGPRPAPSRGMDQG